MVARNMKSASLAELRKMKAKNEVRPPSADAAEIELDETFWKEAEWSETLGEAKEVVSLRLEPWVVAHFRRLGAKHTKRMADVLRAYAKSQNGAKRRQA